MCGIFGAIGNCNITSDLLAGIDLLQHRGQEAAGVFVQERPGVNSYKKSTDLSHLVSDVSKFRGKQGIAHLRYTTTGSTDLCNAQPFTSRDSSIGFIHNGQVANMLQLEAALHAKGITTETQSDGELLLKTFELYLDEIKAGIEPSFRSDENLEECMFRAIHALQQTAIGGYACIMQIDDTGLFAFRDPWGIRPLVMGERNDEQIKAFSSESIALELNDYKNISDLHHGEAILIRQDLSVRRKILEQKQRSNCAFEYIYFADASSIMEGALINDVRYHLGKKLAKRCESILDRIDIVTPIPETPRPAAGGFCEESGKQYKDIIYKRHVKRIFITPQQNAREKKARRGFRYDWKAFTGRSVMLVDDSIVRGTNMREIIRNVREFGAKEVHVAVTWPAVISSCPYGIDMPNLLVAKDKTLEQIREYLDADTLTYATIDDVYDALGRKDLCIGCVTSQYPTPL